MKVGDVVRLFAFGTPCQHNGGEFPADPCCGRVLKIGRKYAHVSTSGSPIRVPLVPTNDNFWTMETQ